MRNIKALTWLLLLATTTIFFQGCKPEYLSSEDLAAYVNDEGYGLVKVKEIGGYTSKLIYRPRDFFIAQELNGESASKEKFKSLHKKYKNYHYFIWELSANGREGLYAGGVEQFSERVQTLSFRMQEFTSLTTSESDTIPLADAVFSRTYGLGNSTSLLLVFSASEVEQDEWISVNISELGFGLGDQLFRFKKSDLEAVPRLEELKGFFEES